jgi:succinyl-diaminopimelate desuccinylase
MGIDFKWKAGKSRQFIIDLAKRLVEVRTVNYNRADYPAKGPDGMDSPGEESKAVAVLTPYFDKMGAIYQVFEKKPQRGNIISSLGLKKEGYRKLLVLLHTDVVPSGDHNEWNSNPFHSFEKDGFLFGRGMADNKGQLAASMASFALLKDIEDKINGEFILGAVADEEVGIERAGFEVLDQALDFGFSVTDAIIPDTSGNNIKIERAEKGRLIVRVTVYGKQAHASTPEEGVNAINAFSEFALLVENHMLKAEKHSLLDGPTVNLGLIKGGSAPNSVAARCDATFDIRIVPGMTTEGVISELQQISQKIKRPYIRFSFDVVQETSPSEVPENAPVIQTIKKYVPEAESIGIGGGTFCQHLRQKGIDAVGWAPGSHKFVHKANERILIDELVNFAGLLAEVSFDLCNQKITG